MRIHEGGISRNTESSIKTNPKPNSSPCAPTALPATDTDTTEFNCLHCPRTFTSRIGLAGHLRIHRTETGEPVPGAPTYTHRTRLHCPHCPRAFKHRMGLFGHMRIHESGIDHNSDTLTTSNTYNMPSTTLDPPPCAPITTNTTASSVADTKTTDFNCPHCPRTFTSRIGLVGHLRIHRASSTNLCTPSSTQLPTMPSHIQASHGPIRPHSHPQRPAVDKRRGTEFRCRSAGNAVETAGPVLDSILFPAAAVERELKNLKEAKSSGPDNIPAKFLKELANELSKPLAHIFRSSFELGKLPSEWKTANIFLIYKGGARNNANNYRPVSLTCICCKIMEAIVKKATMKFLEQGHLLSDLQRGFRQNRSCLSSLLLSTEQWTRALDEDGWVDVIYTDFKKAFDSVSHKRLIYKFSEIGIRGRLLTWITDFLSGRSQNMCIEASRSTPTPVLSGVPQGSVLGPLLFLIYINDCVDDLGCSAIMFANDVKPWRPIRSDEDRQLRGDLIQTYRIVRGRECALDFDEFFELAGTDRLRGHLFKLQRKLTHSDVRRTPSLTGELEVEIKEIIDANSTLIATGLTLEKALQATEPSENISIDNVNIRNRRRSEENVNDEVQHALIKELDIIAKSQNLLKRSISQVRDQIRRNRTAKANLELVISNKLQAIPLDTAAGILKNQSTNKQFFPAVVSLQDHMSCPAGRSQEAHDAILAAEYERMASEQLDQLCRNIVHDVAEDLQQQADKVTNCILRNVDVLEAAEVQLKSKYNEVLTEIKQQQENIDKLHIAIRAKDDPVKVVQTRLHLRRQRCGMDCCEDIPHTKLVSEIRGLADTMDGLLQNLQEAEERMAKLEKCQMELEQEICLKRDSIRVDKIQVLPKRSCQPSYIRRLGRVNAF
nr:unnamed protein product [Spirometra erinaceieuropaei]